MDPGYPPPNPPPPGIGFEMHNVEAGSPYPGVAPAPPPANLYPPINGSTPMPDPPAETHVPIGFEGHSGKGSVPAGVDNAGYVDDGPGRKGTLNKDVTDKGAAAADISLLGFKHVSESGNGMNSALINEAGNSSKLSEGTDDLSEEHRLVETPHKSPLSYSSIINKRDQQTLFFEDGKRQIDYMLAYVSDGNADKARKRDTFQEKLKEQGLELEVAERSQSKDGKTTFVKIHAPWEVLLKYAELLHMKMPLAENDMEDNIRGLWEICCSKFPNPFELDESVVKPEASYFTAVFDRDRVDQYIIGDEKAFFTNGQRSRMVHWILCRTQYETAETGKPKFGIHRLLRSKTYMDAFPLHEGDFKSDHSIYAQGPQNERHLLYEVWARPKNFYKYQPLDLIRKYFGEKVGIYFCWLGYYTMMLIPAALVGLAVFIYGCITVWDDPTSNEICDESMAGNLTMCPSCDKRCSYWRLVTSCTYARISYLFDNEATVAFAFFMALWAVVFLEFWKRKQAELGYDWDVNDYEEEEETVRPEFEISVKKRRTNPINKTEEPYVPLVSRLLRYLTALFVVIFMLAIVIAALFAVIVYRVVIVFLLYSLGDDFIQGRASLITTATAAVLSLVVIIILGFFYKFIARWLTNLEQHRTDTEWEDSFTLKMFAFQFVNYYGTIFYIAFFKGRFTGRPGDYDYTLRYRGEECDPAGCLIGLCIQLAIVMVGKQTINNFKEIILPKLLVWFRSRKIIDKNKDLEQSDATRWEKDYCLANLPDYGLFDEYLEMVIQFGFVTIFVAAFPLAPLFALLNNIAEIRLDAYKFCTQWKRPFARRAEDIGIWFGILHAVAAVAVVSNSSGFRLTASINPLDRFSSDPYRSLPGLEEHGMFAFQKEVAKVVIAEGLVGEVDGNAGISMNATKWWYMYFYEHHKMVIKICQKLPPSAAFIIAVTSDFIPKLVYMYEVSPNKTLSGYINNSLSVFNVSDFQSSSIPDKNNGEEICRYRDYREPPEVDRNYPYTRLYWNILAAKFAFVIVFENAVVFLAWLISYLIPDVPYGVKIQMLREQHLAGQAILEASKIKDDKRRAFKLD